MNRSLIVFLFTALFSVAGIANEKKKIVLSETLRGEVHFSWLMFDIYHARLWASKGKPIYSQPFTLELNYKRNFAGNDITDRSIKELLDQGVQKDKLLYWGDKMRKIFPDVKKGDTIFANYKPGDGVSFYLNGDRLLGAIKDKHFSITFLNIWLGEKTSEQEMRSKLLGDI